MRILEPTLTTTVIGTTFATNSQWHTDEKQLIESIKKQIDQLFPVGSNLLINLTWFGPQFQDSAYYELNNYKPVDRVFFLASVDAPMITSQQQQEIFTQLGAKEKYFLGNFESPQQFSFIATLLPKYFNIYSQQELQLTDACWLYLNYNRKPRQHRVDLVKLLISHNLQELGLISLGAPDPIYSNSDIRLIIDQDPNFKLLSNWNMDSRYGIVHDIHSLGNIEIWQKHFLNIVGETEFFPWDPMFITEKTWKPILGLRPFVINGQTKIYQYLKDSGFKTFEKYFDVELINVDEHQVHLSIIQVIKNLVGQDLKKLYNEMLPDLLHNQLRFFEFVKEQSYRIDHLFEI